MGELEVKRSNFLAFLAPVSTEDAARQFIDSIRRTHPQARHHCSAFIVRSENAQPIARSSDDGEPSGTAGIPMLTTLQGAELVDVCAVVVRYFGGIKLGTGGLVRAYTKAVQIALENAFLVELKTLETATFNCSLAEAGQVDSLLRQLNLGSVDIDYHTQAVFRISYAPSSRDRICTELCQLLRRQVVLSSEGEHVLKQISSEQC